MSELSPAQAIVERILSDAAPPQVRVAAARGALPLPRVDMVRIQVHLLGDGDSQVSQQARNQLDTLADGDLVEVLADTNCSPEVLAFFSERAVRSDALAEAVIFHQAVPESALNVMAERGGSGVIELVLTNQQRVLASPGLLDRLSNNPALRADQRGRILDMLDRFISTAAESITPPAGEALSDEARGQAEFEEAAKLLNVDVGELFAASEIMGGEEFEQTEDPEIRGAYQKIITLNAAQKAILAMRGGREERLILIRDSAKIVSLSVLRNPRINDSEIENMAKMRNVSDAVLRAIGSQREWIKSYAVIKSLVQNPKTPPGISTNFVNRLNDHDLKFLVRDKNVPEIIRRMARRTKQVRDDRKNSSFRKK